MTLKCDSATVIGIIKEKARQAGGNAVLVTEYIKPSFWGSSCHQMTATVLRVSDFSLVEEVDDGGRYDEDIKLLRPERKLSKIDIMANIGYGYRTARIIDGLTPSQRQSVEDLMSGMAWDLLVRYYFSDTGGIGFDYSAYRATADRLGNDVVPSADMITYVGPSFVARFSSNQKWIFDSSVGLGYLGYSSVADRSYADRKVTGATVGWKISLGASYKLSENWGIGAEMGLLSGLLDRMNIHENGTKISQKLPEKEGLGQFRIGLGIRYSIK